MVTVEGRCKHGGTSPYRTYRTSAASTQNITSLLHLTSHAQSNNGDLFTNIVVHLAHPRRSAQVGRGAHWTLRILHDLFIPEIRLFFQHLAPAPYARFLCRAFPLPVMHLPHEAGDNCDLQHTRRYKHAKPPLSSAEAIGAVDRLSLFFSLRRHDADCGRWTCPLEMQSEITCAGRWSPGCWLSQTLGAAKTGREAARRSSKARKMYKMGGGKGGWRAAC